MYDTAVLLNLTSKLTFELTDPLMSVINAKAPLLFYDLLSIEAFPLDVSKRPGHMERLASGMRNMLEARALSSEDRGERIRLIVTLDLDGDTAWSDCSPAKFFPAQKARLFMETIQRVFGKGNPLLKRFEYCFIFIDGKTGSLYQTAAYNGYCSGDTDEWITSTDVRINRYKEDLFSNLDEAPDDEALLNELGTHYNRFASKLMIIRDKLAERMEAAGLKEQFLNLFNDGLQGIRTIGDFHSFDYDSHILSCVTRLTGLRSEDFRGNCTFFILPRDSGIASTRRTCELFIGSLIQFLSTVPSDQFDNILKSNALSLARIFVLDDVMLVDLDNGSLRTLEKDVKGILPIMERSRWKKEMKVPFKQYVPNAQDPKTVDSYGQLNDKLESERKEMFQRFVSGRKVPFFFGRLANDWSWYKRSIRNAEEILRFETVNDRPLFDPPKRISDNEMKSQDLVASYTELETRIETLVKEAPPKQEGMDLNEYLAARRKLVEEFALCIDGPKQDCLKKSMVKLGFFTCLFWIGFLSLVAFTLNFAYHFFWFDNEDSLWLVAACFGAAAILFILSAIVGRVCVKSKIESIHKRMDDIYRQLQNNLQLYLDDVSRRVKEQNDADIRRRNIDEMESKLKAFYRHNKQVDIWKEFFLGLHEKLAFDIQLFPTASRAPLPTPSSFQENDFNLEGSAPSLPKAIRDHFKGMQVTFTHRNIPASDLTSFTTHFRFTEQTC